MHTAQHAFWCFARPYAAQYQLSSGGPAVLTGTLYQPLFPQYEGTHNFHSFTVQVFALYWLHHPETCCADWNAVHFPSNAVRGHPQLPQLHRAQARHRARRQAIHAVLPVRAQAGGSCCGGIVCVLWCWFVGLLVCHSGVEAACCCPACSVLPQPAMHMAVGIACNPPLHTPPQLPRRV